MSKKIAVVLFNLGGPDCKNAIKPFLMNFFMDKNIIGAPIPIRCLLAWRISNKRSKREAGDSYKELGDKSPLLDNTNAQRNALDFILAQKNDGNTYKVFTCMRYWHPMSPQVVREVRDWGAEKIILLPLYPQFSTTTSWSSLGVWKKAITEAGMENIPTSMVCCYPEENGFIEASAENLAQVYSQAMADGHENPRVLFSAHGLPEKVVKGGDPYQWQCEQSAEKIAQVLKAKLGIENLDWEICYQSRVGPLKWIEPSTEDAIEKGVQDGKALIIYPHAFTQEHVETLVELDIEYRHVAEAKGIKGYYRAETVGTHPAYINGLADMVQDHLDKQEISAQGGRCICPDTFGRCCMRVGKLH